MTHAVNYADMNNHFAYS